MDICCPNPVTFVEALLHCYTVSIKQNPTQNQVENCCKYLLKEHFTTEDASFPLIMDVKAAAEVPAVTFSHRTGIASGKVFYFCSGNDANGGIWSLTFIIIIIICHLSRITVLPAGTREHAVSL